MVRGSTPRRWLIALVFVAATGTASCVKKQTVKMTREYSGSCEGVCHHYVVCKSDEDGRIYRACIGECRIIYSEDGVEDEGTLGELERLDCDEIIGFVEGDSGSPPGTGDQPISQPAAARDGHHSP